MAPSHPTIPTFFPQHRDREQEDDEGSQIDDGDRFPNRHDPQRQAHGQGCQGKAQPAQCHQPMPSHLPEARANTGSEGQRQELEVYDVTGGDGRRDGVSHRQMLCHDIRGGKGKRRKHDEEDALQRSLSVVIGRSSVRYVRDSERR